MLTFEIEEDLEKLIEEKKEEINLKIDLQNEEEDEKIYPLFRNYPNGTPDYYLKLKSMEFDSWKNDFRILFIDKTFSGDKYFTLLKKLGCKITKQNKNNQVYNYNLIISNDANKVSEMMTDKPVIYINCNPVAGVSKKSLFYFDNKRQCRKYSYYFYSNEVEHLYREKTNDFIDAISKMKEMII